MHTGSNVVVVVVQSHESLSRKGGISFVKLQFAAAIMTKPNITIDDKTKKKLNSCLFSPVKAVWSPPMRGPLK